MNTFQALLQSVRQIKTLDACAYTLGYVNAEYNHDFITRSEYDILFNLIQRKRRVLI